MFAIPEPTPYDVKFPLLGIPVRVHPFFWLMTAALGWDTHERYHVFVWIACVFVSILVHEFGHALTARWLCQAWPKVYFYFMGGLCAYDREEQSPWRRAAVLAMGPGAGFLLFGLVLAVGLSVLGNADVWPYGEIFLHDPPAWFLHLPVEANRAIEYAYHDLIWINLFWGLFNLLPIYPLDGGQLAHVFLTTQNRREGPARTYLVGILTAGGLALYFASQALQSEGGGSWFRVFFVANLAFLNYQLLQAEHAQRGTYSSYGDDDNWWRR
jgi:stage IV sporulation protein FB